MVNSRARPSDSRSPRFDVTSACSSSRITRLSEPNRYGASAEASSSASCSGVVSRMSGGSRRWRWRFEAGVSPVRVSMRIGRPSRRPAFEVARDVDRERLERRDVERVQPACGGCRGRWRRASCRRGFAALRAAQFHQLGRNPASVLPAPVGAISSAERPARASAAVRADARAATSRATRTSA